MNKKLSIKNYIAIADWMLDLGLNTRELLTYALIYGFSQDGEVYFGSLSYLASWLGIEDRTHATRYLNSLVNKKLLIKASGRSKINQKVCLYRTCNDNGPIIDNPDIDYIIIQPWMMQEMHLNGKDLLLYALVHGYSRKESGNICEYKKDYYAKWLQCRKDHVDRQINRLLDKGLIKKANDNGFQAIVPAEISLTQTGNTPLDEDEVDFTQIDNTYTQTGNTPSPKLATNNLNLDNLEDNLLSNNNIEYKSKEELSVVVNKEISSDMDFSIDYSLKAFTCKIEKDFNFYQKYKNSDLDIALIMSGYARAAQVDLEMYFSGIDEEGKTLYEKGSDLLLKIITNKRFSSRGDLISSLNAEKISQLYSVASNLFSTDEEKKISYNRTREAYLIGVIENTLSQN